MKPAELSRRLSPLLPLLQCSRCGQPLRLTEQSMLCTQGHCYDLSRRGYVNLAPSHDQAAEKYDATLFESRRMVLENGFYTPVAEAICHLLPTDRPFSLLDAGCGEGYYARLIAQRFPMGQVLGVDLSRDAVTAAARVPGSACFFVADLKRLPVRTEALDVVLDVLTPADYGEFGRVLKPDGLLIKAVPGTDYLHEVRSAVAPWLRGGDAYDNRRVLDHLRSHADVLSETSVRVTLPLTPQLSDAFLRMTPMTFSVPEEALASLSLTEITLHMHVLACRLQKRFPE